MKVVKFTNKKDLDFFKKVSESKGSISFGFEVNKNLDKLDLFKHFPDLVTIEYVLPKIENLAKKAILLIENESIAIDFSDNENNDILSLALIPAALDHNKEMSMKIYNFLNNLLYYGILEFKTYPASTVEYDVTIYSSPEEIYMKKEDILQLFGDFTKSDLLDIMGNDIKYLEYLLEVSENYDTEFINDFLNETLDKDKLEEALSQITNQLSKFLKIDLLTVDLARNQLCISFTNEERMNMIKSVTKIVGGFKLIDTAETVKIITTSLINKNYIAFKKLNWS